MKSKRGVSPVVATALLVSVALILAVVVFFWARSFIAEDVTKNGSDIAQSCEDASFSATASVSSNSILIQNTGTVSIYAIEVSAVLAGSIEAGQVITNSPAGTRTNVGPGESGEYALSGFNGDIIIKPVLLGETDVNRVPRVCEDEVYGVDVRVA